MAPAGGILAPLGTCSSILIDCSLSGTFKWSNKDSLYHGTAFSNQVLFMAKIIPGEILGIFFWNTCVYWQHMTFSDFQQ